MSQILSGGRGHVIYRNGRPRPLRYCEVTPRKRIELFDSIARLAVVGNCTIALDAITSPERTSITIPKIAQVAPITNTFWDQTFPAPVAPGARGYTNLWFDIYIERPPTPSTAGTGSAGVALTLFLTVGAFGAGVNIACTFEATYGWSRIDLGKAEFSTALGGATWDASTFNGIRWKISGTTGWSHTLFMREVGWI